LWKRRVSASSASTASTRRAYAHRT
jgi:hypothetical protein